MTIHFAAVRRMVHPLWRKMINKWMQSQIRRWLSLIEATVNDPMLDPNFRRWFGRSRVVDAAGRPLPVYHGTQDDIRVFGNTDDIPDRGGLIAFFSTSPEFASNYATGGVGANVLKVYLHIERPFDYRKHAHEAHDFWEETGGIGDKWESNRILMGLGHQIDNIDDRDTPDLTEEEFAEAVGNGSWDALESPEFVHYLRQAGYDGIITLENNAINFGIFEPTQVKSVFARNFAADRDDISEAV